MVCGKSVAGRGIAPEWQMKRDLLSPAYTTRWSDIPIVHLQKHPKGTLEYPLDIHRIS